MPLYLSRLTLILSFSVYFGLINIIIEREAAERDMREWIDVFIQEIDKIENFYNSKFAEYCTEFDIIRDTFTKKKNGIKNRDKLPPKGQPTDPTEIQMASLQREDL
jgi:hypothetical protein